MFLNEITQQYQAQITRKVPVTKAAKGAGRRAAKIFVGLLAAGDRQKRRSNERE